MERDKVFQLGQIVVVVLHQEFLKNFVRYLVLIFADLDTASLLAALLGLTATFLL